MSKSTFRILFYVRKNEPERIAGDDKLKYLLQQK